MGIEWDRLCLPCSQITRKVETTVSRVSHSDLEYREVGMKMRIQVQSPRRRRRKTESCRRKSCGGLGSGIWRRAGQGDRVREGKKSSRAASRVKSGRGAGLEGWKLAGDLGTRGRGRASLPERAQSGPSVAGELLLILTRQPQLHTC